MRSILILLLLGKLHAILLSCWINAHSSVAKHFGVLMVTIPSKENVCINIADCMWVQCWLWPVLYRHTHKHTQTHTVLCFLATIEWFFSFKITEYFLSYSDIYRSKDILKNFNEFLTNLFMPLYEVSIDPRSHEKLHKFLQQVSWNSHC